MNFDIIKNAILDYEDVEVIKDELKALIDSGADPTEIVDKGLMPALDKIGEEFSSGEAYIAEMMMVAESVKDCIATLKPMLASKENVQSKGKILIGTVKNDIHDIGKNLVITLFEAAGFDVVDLGINVQEEQFAQGIIDNPDAKILGISALLTATLPGVTDTINYLKEHGLRDKVKIIVGGAPIHEEFIKQCGADAWGKDAAIGIEYARSVYGENNK